MSRRSRRPRCAGSAATGSPRSSRSGPPPPTAPPRRSPHALGRLVPGQRPHRGRAQTVAGLTRDDLVEFHATAIGPSGATIVVAGDLTGVDVLDVLEGTLGTWTAPRHRPADPPVAPVVAPDAERVVVVDRPGSVQTEILVARPAPDRSTPDGWAPHPVISFVLGGSPSARVDAVLREEKGYTYGIRTAFRPRVAGGPGSSRRARCARR